MPELCFYCADHDATWPETATTLASCDRCHDRENERAHEQLIANFYGGSDGPSEQDREDYARETGRRRW